MKRLFMTFMVSLLTVPFLHGQIAYKVDLSPFPKAEAGMQQYIIEVPYGIDGEDYNKRVEIYAGKYHDVDKCNTFGLMGSFEEKALEGYGYNYYVFNSKGDVFGTMKGCMDGEKINKFVVSQSVLTRYNGRMPIVIYAPEGFEVRYRIFRADAEEYAALVAQ